MQHIDEHTIELYVLGSGLVKEQRNEIERHFAECHGCRALAGQMEAIYRDAEKRLAEQPDLEMKPGKALVRAHHEPVLFAGESYDYPIPYQPKTVIGKFTYFVRRHPVAAGVGGFGMAGVLVLLGMLISNPFKRADGSTVTDHNPAFRNYNTTTDMLEVLNADHQLLWQRKGPDIPSAQDRENQSGSYETLIADLYGDGKNELMTCLNILGYNTSANDKHLLVFDYEGKLLWNQKFTEDVHYLGRSYSPHFNAAALLVTEERGTGEKNIIVMASNESRSPSILYRLDNHGNVLGTYWHFGLVLALYSFDLKGDGSQEIILCGKNDVNDTTHEEFSSVAVLDPLKIIGQRRSTTCPGFELPPSDAEMFYLKFPRVDIDDVNHTSSAIYKMEKSDSATLKFKMGNFDNWMFDFFIDHTMRVLETKSYDRTDILHKQLEEQGKLSGTIDRAYLENLKKGVRYWDGREWRKEATQVSHEGEVSMR